ncbi:Histone-lysine N-methyltransferase 2E [Desmophyllum pertusum]|uniref:Histone-lysine N-methyltransferase 2E n=1 Tax=Desmophyllum pertusum TaxID=174260 RepID=A0A9W9Z9T8_9CNID|nr:Histone-lysine N-methyltransferase 2E [Desmophyllum pertusum]
MNVNLLLETAPPGISKPMTAGSDPQPAESSTAPKMPSIASIRHIPHILDHNYGQPPPMTPPDSNSPGPEDGDTGNEDDEDDGVTRCICEFDHDDGYMICCDKCSVWQHIECMGISSDAVPENYLCDKCQPRTLDKDRARAIQQRKREEQSDDDDDDDDSEEDRDTPSYIAISNTPTRITLTAKVSQKRKRGPNKIKVKDQDNLHSENHDKDKKPLPKRRRRQKPKLPPGFVPVDEETSEAWDSMCNSFDHYEELKENIYSKELEQLALNSVQENGFLPAVANDGQLCKVVEVQRYRKGIVTIEDMDKDKFVIQCKGKLMLLAKFESENPFFKRCSPYVFYYSELDHLQLCVDARTHGNDARFVRRSCSPNSEVRHFMLSGRVCLGIFSSCPLPKGAEITIPFEFQYEEYHSNLDCACAQDMCAVMKYNLKFQNENHDSHTQKRFKAHDEDSNSEPHQKMSPLRVSLGNSQSLQGDSDSDIENNPEKQGKKSREERKLEAYLRQIDKMEKKEKRKQQTQKEHKHELMISPVNQEVVSFNKFSSKNIKGIKQALNKRRTATPGFKRKRARLSSCSSEPLSPEDHSSTASTPTTPKVTSVSSLPEQEPCSVTPSTSPNRSFRFPKDDKQYAEEEPKETTPTRDSTVSIKTELVDDSEASTPNSPITPREESELKPVLNTASSTTDHDIIPEVSDVVSEDTVPAPDAMCSTSTVDVDSTQFSKDLSSSLTECLVEINIAVGSGRNTPSPCPSTSGSPTSAESVTSSYSGSATERTSPGPAPGSPVASIKFGHRAARSSPLYGSLKKRWLFQYLCDQNMVNDRPPNGFKLNVGSPMGVPVNGKTIPSSLRRNGLPKIIDPLPLKKRHLKRYQNMACEMEEPANSTIQTFPSEPPCEEPLIVSSPVALEQPVQIVLADSVNDLQPHKEETITVNNEQIPLREETLLKVHTCSTSSSIETINSTVTSPNNMLMSNDSSGTPGKKKVSLLEYRNRSRNRLSVDLPRTSPQHATVVTTPTNASTASSVFTPSVIKSSSLSASLPNLSEPSTTPLLVHRRVVSSAEMNGPHLEPVSPDSEDKSSGLLHRLSKIPNSVHIRGSSYSRGEGKGLMYGEGDSRLKREHDKKLVDLFFRNSKKQHEQLTRKEEGRAKFSEKLTSFISEQLQKDSKSKPSAVIDRSPSTSSNESSNPPAELTSE